MSIISSWIIVLFQFSVFLTFYLVILSIVETWTLKLLFYCSLYVSVEFCQFLLHIFWCSLTRYIYAHTCFSCYIFLLIGWFIVRKCPSFYLLSLVGLKSIFPEISRHSTFLLVAVYISFSLFFNHPICILNLKYVSCRYHKAGSHFLLSNLTFY